MKPSYPFTVIMGTVAVKTTVRNTLLGIITIIESPFVKTVESTSTEADMRQALYRAVVAPGNIVSSCVLFILDA